MIACGGRDFPLSPWASACLGQEKSFGGV